MAGSPLRLIQCCALTLLAACSADSRANAPLSGSSDSASEPGNIGAENADDRDEDADPAVCGQQDFAIAASPVRVMILLDMSASMRGERWMQAREALLTLLDRWRGRGIHFGFNRFSNPGGCDVSAPVVQDTAAGAEQTIMDALASMEPGGSTPLYCGMQNFTRSTYSPSFLDSAEGSSYLLVISDGGDYCGTTCTAGGGLTNPVEPHLRALTESLFDAHGVRTFAIGFGDSFDDAELNQIVAGGHTNRNAPFDAADGVALQAAFEDIAQSVVSCVYALGERPGTDRDDVNIYFDGDVVGLDDRCASGTGWHWTDATRTRIELCPVACGTLQNGEVTHITATFGCPTVTII